MTAAPRLRLAIAGSLLDDGVSVREPLDPVVSHRPADRRQNLLDGDRLLRSSELTKALKLTWRGSKKSKNGSVRQAPFYVLSQMPLPSALVELGFLTHPDDLAALTDAREKRRMAEDLFRGLVAYKESMDKYEVTP